MRRLALFSGVTLSFLGGCVVVGTYEYDDYKDGTPGSGGSGTSSISSSSSSASSSSSSSGSAGMGGMGGGGGGELAMCSPNMGDGDCSVKAVWEGRFGDKFHQQVKGLATNSAGEVALGGEFVGDIIIGNRKVSNSTSDFHPFAAKLNSDGTIGFMHQIDKKGRANGVTLKASNLVIAGSYASMNDSMQHHGFVRSVDPNGSFMLPTGWNVELSAGPDNKATAVTTTEDPNSPVLVTGSVGGAVSFKNCSTFVGYTGTTIDTFLMALNPTNGQCLWATTILNSTGVSIVANANNVVIAGFYKGIIALPNPSIPNGTDAYGAFVAVYDPMTGTQKWHKTFAGSEVDNKVSFFSVAMDDGGDVYTSGSLQGKVTMGNKYTSSLGGTSLDTLIVAFNGSTGDVKWVDRFGGAGLQIASTISIANNQVYVGGRTGAAMATSHNVDTGTLCGTSDCMFLFRLASIDGAPTWSRAFGGAEATMDSTVRLAAGPKGLWIAGGWADTIDFGRYVLPPIDAPPGQDIVIGKFSPLP